MKQIEAENVFIKGWFLPVYIRCLNEHLLQREIHRFILQNSTLHQNVIYLFFYNDAYRSTSNEVAGTSSLEESLSCHKKDL
jgi:hypothetical protein